MGSSENDSSNGITTDSNGNILAVGSSNTTWGTPINPHAENYDAFVVKVPVFSPTPVPSIISNQILPGYQVANQTVTTTIIGRNFLSSPIIKLKKSGQPDITADNVIIKSSFWLTCVFDLVNASQGIYNLFVDQGTSQNTLTKAFTVLQPAPNPGKWQIQDIGSCGVPQPTGSRSSITLGDADDNSQNEVYVTNRNNYFYQWCWLGGNWSRQDLPPFPDTEINHDILAFDKNRDGIAELYLASQDAHVYSYSAPGWGKTDLGATAAAVKALSIGDGNNDGEIEIYGATENSHVYQFKWNGTNWDQTDLGTAAGQLKAVTVGDGNNDNQFEVYAASSDQTIYQFSYNSGWTVTPIGSGNSSMTSVKVANLEQSSSQAVYAANEDGHIYQFKKTASNWATSVVGTSVEESAFFNIVASDGDNSGTMRLYAACDDGNVYQLEYSVDNWTTTILGNCGTPLYALEDGDAGNDNQHELYTLGENNHIYQLKYIPTVPTATPTFTPTATITPIAGFSGRLLDKQYTYFAPNPVRGRYFKFVVHVPRECNIECKLFTTSNKFVLKFNLHCSGPGKYEHQEYVGNLANGVYLLLVKAKSPDGTQERLIKKLGLIK